MRSRTARATGLITALALVAGAGAYSAVQQGHADIALRALAELRDRAVAAAGFEVTEIVLTGNREVGRDDILASAGVSGSTSLLFLDADAVRVRLKTNPWIAEATILKLYSGRLNIAVNERRAVALWQKDGKISVIAADGTVVQPYVDVRFASLPLVVGGGAQKQARDILPVVAGFPSIRDQVRAYVLVAERRWNLHLKNGIDVRLPEDDPAGALEILAGLDRDKKILSRDVLAIDLRLPGRVTVRLSDAAAAARAEQLRKLKRKGDDA